MNLGMHLATNSFQELEKFTFMYNKNKAIIANWIKMWYYEFKNESYSKKEL